MSRTTSCVLLAGLVFGAVLRVTAGETPADVYARGVQILHERGIAGVDDAVALFRQAAERAPESVAAHQAIADALILKYEFSETKDRAWLEDALASLDEVLRLRPGNGKAYFSKATAYFDLGDRNEGVRNLRKALLGAPRDMEINLAWFYHLLESKQVEEAAAFAESSAALFPDNTDIFKLYGDGLLAAGRADLAAREYTTSLRISADNAAAHAGIGHAFRAAGQFEEAVASYEEALALDPQFQQAHVSIGYCAAALGDYEKAIAHTQEYLSSSPNDVSALNNLALCYEKTGKTAEARKAWMAVRDLPDAPDTYRERARTHLEALRSSPAE